VEWDGAGSELRQFHGAYRRGARNDPHPPSASNTVTVNNPSPGGGSASFQMNGLNELTVSGVSPGLFAYISDNGQPLAAVGDGVVAFATNGTSYTITASPPVGETCTVANPGPQVFIPGGVWIFCQPTNFTPPTSSWTPLTNQAPIPAGTLLLLSDGSVLTNGESQGASLLPSGRQQWYRLIPASDGHYINGTWTQVASSNCSHGFFASQVLMNGKVFVAGGEYPEYLSTGTAPAWSQPGCAGPGYSYSGVDTEIYDPVADTWTMADPPTSLSGVTFINPQAKPTYSSPCSMQAFGDMISESLPDGSVLMAPVCPNKCGDTLIFNINSFNPSTPGSGWSLGGTLANIGTTASAYYTCSQLEDTWVKLADGSILTADPPPSSGANQTSERYVFSQHKWIADQPLGFRLYDSEFGLSGSGEMGPAFLLPDGEALFIGGGIYTGLYTPQQLSPPSGFTASSSFWTPSTLIPFGPETGYQALSADDTSGAMMVNGKILLALNYAATPTDVIPQPTFFFEYDPVQNTYTEVAGPNYTQISGQVNVGAQSPWTDCGGVLDMVDLPDGTVLMGSGCNTKQLYVYQPSGSPLPQGQPTIIGGITHVANNTYQVTGTLFNGISEGASEGDDEQMATNYPLVRLTSSNGTVTYARTHDWTSNGLMTGSTPVTTQFDLPSSITQASSQTYSLQVIANGNPSASVSFVAGVANPGPPKCTPSCGSLTTTLCGTSNGCGGTCNGYCRQSIVPRESCVKSSTGGYSCVSPPGGP
jgi:hypothetical protein